MPYKSADLCLYVFLPKVVDGLAAFEKALTGERLYNLMKGAHSEEVIVGRSAPHRGARQVAVPKLKLEQQFNLNDALKAIGMGSMFDQGEADFSNFADEPLFVSDVVHKAFLEVRSGSVSRVWRVACARRDASVSYPACSFVCGVRVQYSATVDGRGRVGGGRRDCGTSAHEAGGDEAAGALDRRRPTGAARHGARRSPALRR